jgi:hypothetical protein
MRHTSLLIPRADGYRRAESPPKVLGCLGVSRLPLAHKNAHKKTAPGNQRRGTERAKPRKFPTAARRNAQKDNHFLHGQRIGSKSV